MLNKVMLIGHVGGECEMKFTAAGNAFANFWLAVNETYKTSSGEKKTNVLWIRCVAWRRWAEIAGEFVTKGKFLYVEGRLQQRSFEDRDGKKHEVMELVVGLLRFLGPAKNGNGVKANESSKEPEHVEEGDNPFNDGGNAEEIPF